MYPACSPLHMPWCQICMLSSIMFHYVQYQAAVSAEATSNANAAQPAASQPLNLAHVPGE